MSSRLIKPITIEREEAGAALGTGTLHYMEVADGNLRQEQIGYRLYDYGTEHVSWVTGYSTGTGTATKESDYLSLTATFASNGVRTFVIDQAVDVTDAAKLKMLWKNDGDDSSRNRSYCVVSSNKNSDQDTYDARRYRQNIFDYTSTPDEVDVSGLTGNKYIRFHAQGVSGSTGGTARVKVYAVWLEDSDGRVIGVLRFAPSGYRIWPVLNSSACREVEGSLVQFTKNQPAGTELKVYALKTTSDVEPDPADPNWAEQTSGQPLTVISVGEDLDGKRIWTKIAASTTDPAVTPTLSLLRVEINGQQILTTLGDVLMIGAAEASRVMELKRSSDQLMVFVAEEDVQVVFKALDQIMLALAEKARLINIHSAMNALERKIFGRVEITYTDPFLDESIEATATEVGQHSDPAAVADNVVTPAYKWFSLHRNKLDGSYHPMPGNDASQVGWWGKRLSGPNGKFFEPISMIDFSRPSPAYHPDTGEEVPVDTPIFVKFAEGRLGSLMCEGVTNLLTENQSSFETSAQLASCTGFTPEQSDDWSYHGNYSAKLVKASDSRANFYQSRSLSSVDVGTMFSISCYVFVPPGNNYIGKTVQARVRFAGGAQPTSFLSVTDYVLRQGVQRLTASAPLDYADRTLVGISVTEPREPYGEWQPEGSYFYVDGLQIEQKPYPTPWHIGGGTRAAPLKRITLPEALPATFGIGIAAKMLHAHDTATRTFWQAGDYRCYFDSTDNKLKITNGVVEAETAAVSWSEDDYVGIYAGRQNGKLFLQAKIAGALTDRVEAEAGAGTGETLYVGSRADGSESVNAVVADMVFHDRPEDIDPEGYLAGVPGGGEE
jgi:hypothetical protein